MQATIDPSARPQPTDNNTCHLWQERLFFEFDRKILAVCRHLDLDGSRILSHVVLCVAEQSVDRVFQEIQKKFNYHNSFFPGCHSAMEHDAFKEWIVRMDIILSISLEARLL